ncbi:MAG: TROVE domain-containing protein [bacterium]|nr:TROVE domain-containing protein [bacterium]
MVKKALTFLSNQKTPQDAPIPGTNQVRNSAGGYSWQVDSWQRLRRFLILGSEGGSYYATEQALTVENANNVLHCIHTDGQRTVREIVAVSQEGRAPKNDPAIFALALACAHGDPDTRRDALDALPKVCRTATHLFQFTGFVNGMRGWGRGLRRGVSAWYRSLEGRDLAYQVVKYRQREGWTHTDTLRLAHVTPQTDTQNAIFKWVTKREQATWVNELTPPDNNALALIWAFEQVQTATDLNRVLKLITDYDLPREALPTQWLNEAAVWAAMLPKMPMTAMIRNLATMSRVGLLTPLSEAENTVVSKLTNADALRKARVHLIAVLSAMRVYALGFSLKGRAYAPHAANGSGGKEWTATPRILDALDTAFELAFKNVEPTNQRMMLALDVSGSMSTGAIAGVPVLTPRDGSAAMAMVTARTETNYHIISFQDRIVPLNISAKMRLTDVVQATSNLPFGRTDCAQPMVYAQANNIPVDTFVIYTDSETWANPQLHPVQALREYREKTGIASKLVVVGMVANNFTIADPNDSGMLDVVGFDTAAPAVIADFTRGTL